MIILATTEGFRETNTINGKLFQYSLPQVNIMNFATKSKLNVWCPGQPETSIDTIRSAYHVGT